MAPRFSSPGDLSHHTVMFSTIRHAKQSIFIQTLTLQKMAKTERKKTVWGSFCLYSYDCRGQVALNSKEDSKTYLPPAVPHASSVKLLWGGYLRTF